jgi:hypothetical protein
MSKDLRATGRTAIRIALAAASLVALGACASIPQRAWRNGEAMSQSRAYQRAMGGEYGFTIARHMEQSLDPLRLGYREAAYPAFGQWW